VFNMISSVETKKRFTKVVGCRLTSSKSAKLSSVHDYMFIILLYQLFSHVHPFIKVHFM
jgi:hypothetical protein